MSLSTIDCHSHLSFLPFDRSSSILNEAPDLNFALGGYDRNDWQAQLKLKELYPDRVTTSFGLHPWLVKGENFNLDEDFGAFKSMVDQADMVGEIGLDFFGKGDIKKELQLSVFEKQLEMATFKPVVLHIVQAHGAALKILNDHSVKGFVHSFTGATEVAKQYVDMGLKLSFGPAILNPDFKKCRDSLESLPLESILIESDRPSEPGDLTSPVETLQEVAKTVARIKNLSVKQLFNQVETNFNNLF